MRMFRKSDEGFTLVELMVVVLIIGILVAIAIPVFNAARANAQQRSCQANLRTLDGATEQWRAEDVGNNPGAWANVAAAQTALAPFVKVWPSCPSGTAAVPVNYTVDTDATAQTASFECSVAGHEYP